MALFTWEDKFSVNIASIDEQHKVLFDMINSLHEAMLTGRGKKVVGEVLDGLYDYTMKHFTYEEELLQKINYDQYDDHLSEHDEFREKIMRFKEDFHTGNAILTSEILTFLVDWLRRHILVIDKQYSGKMIEKGIT